MQNRERIIRILAALKAKFAEGSGCTQQEALAALEQYNKLKHEYDINETDVHIKQEGVGMDEHVIKTGKAKPPIWYLINPIGKLSQTRGLVSERTGKAYFIGTRVDRDYAEFLLRVCESVISTSWYAYNNSPDYKELKASGVSYAKIRKTFETALAGRLTQRMLALAAANGIAVTGNSLVLVKNELIQAFMDNGGFNTREQKALTRYVKYDTAVNSALDAADKAQIQYQTKNDSRLLGCN